MDRVANLLLLFVRIAAYACATGHALKVFGLPSQSTPGKAWRACKNAGLRLLACCCCRRRAPTGILDGLVRNRMDEFKLRQYLILFQVIQHLAILAMILRLLNYERRALLGMTNDESLGWFLFRALAVYVMSLFVTTECVQLTVFRLHILYVVQMCAFMIYIIQLRDDPSFFLNMGFRTLVRLTLGLLYLDHVKACWWNIVFTIVVLGCYNFNSSLLQPAQESLELRYAYGEACTCMLIVAIQYCIEKGLESQLRSQIVAEHQKNASLKLLGYQCDAIVWLTPELGIDGPAPQLAQLLLLEAARNHLDGREFQRYVANDSERDRFRRFIETSTATQGTDAPPAVLHVHLRDATSTNIPVDVFHVHCIDLEDRERHLLGIRETAAHAAPQQQLDRRHEQPQHATQRQQLGREERNDQAAPGLPSVDEGSSASSSAAPALPVRPTAGAAPSESSVSASSVGDAPSSGVSDILIKLDVFSGQFTMSECTLVFQSTRHMPAPGFLSLLPSSSVSGLKRWAQSHANCIVHGNRPDHLQPDAGRILLNPAGELRIAAESTRLIFPRNFGPENRREAMLRLRGITLHPARDELNEGLVSL